MNLHAKFTCQLKLAESKSLVSRSSLEDIDEASIDEAAMDQAVANERQAFEEFTASLENDDDETDLHHGKFLNTFL